MAMTKATLLEILGLAMIPLGAVLYVISRKHHVFASSEVRELVSIAAFAMIPGGIVMAYVGFKSRRRRR